MTASGARARAYSSEAALARSERSRAEIERIAQVGSWEWDVVADQITWSDELFRIYGLERDAFDLTYEGYVARTHVDDRRIVAESVARARAGGSSFSHVHRIMRPDGEERVLLGRGEVVLGEDGTLLRMVGTAQDITERIALEREVAARQAAEAARDRAEFLAEAGIALAATLLDLDRTLTAVAMLAVPRVADWCAVDLLVAGELQRVAVECSSDEMARLEDDLAACVPDYPGSLSSAHVVIRTGQSVRRDVTDVMIDERAHDMAHASALRSRGLRAFIIAPLVGHDTTLGTITLGSVAPRVSSRDDDLFFAEELGRRAGIAIESARLYRTVLESQEQLEQQATELEAQTSQLQELTADTQASNEQLRKAGEALRRRSAEAEAARRETSTILESIGDAFFALDEHWCFTYVNERAEPILQRPRATLIGRNVWDEFAGAVGSAFHTSFTRVMTERVPEQFEEYFAPRDAWFAVSAYPAALGGITVFFQDVTKRKRADLEFRALAETMPQLVWSTNPDGYHDYFNSRWYEFTGMAHDGSSQGWNWKDFLHRDDYARAVQTWDRSLASGQPYSIEYRIKEALTGEYQWFLGRALPLRDESGTIVRWFGTCTDIDETKRAERARDAALEVAQVARAEAENANRAKAEFLAMMSHELRTPINAALGYAELLVMGVRGEMSAAQIADLGRIQRSQRLLLSLVNDVLNFARLDAGRIEYHIADVSLEEVFGTLETMVAPQMTAKGLRYAPRPCVEHVNVRADAEKLQQVLLNLITNSIKFTESGGTIELSCAMNATHLDLVVRDTGRGIAPEQLERVFEPFVQVDRHLTNASQQGVGLGLAISRDLMRGMGGDLVAESRVGAGSTFTARLPRTRGNTN